MKKIIIMIVLSIVGIIGIMMIFYRTEKMTEFEITRIVKEADYKIHDIVTKSLDMNNPTKLKELENELGNIDINLRERLKDNDRNHIIELHEDLLIKAYRVLEEKIKITENKLPISSQFDKLLDDFGKSYESLNRY